MGAENNRQNAKCPHSADHDHDDDGGPLSVQIQKAIRAN